METSNEEIKVIEYSPAKFIYRVLANLLDFIIFVMVFFGLFSLARNIVTNTGEYKKIDAEMNQLMLNCHLYRKSDLGGYESILTYLDNKTNMTAAEKVNECIKVIDDFSIYLSLEAGEDIKIQFLKEYDECRLLEKFKDEKNRPYFIKNENNEIVFNTDENGYKYIPDVKYYENFYSPFIEEKCLGYFTTYVKAYSTDLNKLSVFLFVFEIPPAYIISAILVYFIPTLIFKRGRKTIGKFAYKIGLIDSGLYSPSFRRNLARSCIVIFGEFILSLFTFGIPFIISFTMMAFSKRRQGFPDYMLSLIEVDTSKTKIYFNKIDAQSASFEVEKKPIDFIEKKRY